jgi:Photosynthetic reaction centre cytochrome C subunit
MQGRTLLVIVSCVLIGIGAAASAKATRNLKVLPKDIPDGELAGLMVRYSRELGVQCQFCHAEGPNGIDFASDESPAKLTARVMIGMLSDINTKYLAQVGDRRYSVPLTCGNCHQGQTTPPLYENR